MLEMNLENSQFYDSINEIIQDLKGDVSDKFDSLAEIEDYIKSHMIEELPENILEDLNISYGKDVNGGAYNGN